MNIDGTNKTRITSNFGNCTDASFTSDGKNIVFSSDFQVKIANIYQISLDGKNTIKLTNYNGYDGAVSISNDSSKLIFESVNVWRAV
jgi:TolB protein